jgi:preprotein translocase subunit SecG
MSLPARIIISVLGLGSLFGVASFFFSQFTQARNIVNNLAYSRVMLAGLYLVLALMLLVVTC